MKHFRRFFVLFTCCVTWLAHGQGTVVFYNHVVQVGLDQPVFDLGGTAKISNPNVVAQLLAGPDANSLMPVSDPQPFMTGASAGYWQPQVVTIPGVTGGETAWAIVQAWDITLGATYSEAKSKGGYYGESVPFTILTGGDTLNGTQPPSFPGYMLNFKTFVPVPEPTVIALALAGAGLLFARRSRNKV